MKYTLKNMEEKLSPGGHDIRLFTLVDEKGTEVKVEGGLWSEEQYYDNSFRIENVKKFGEYLSRQDFEDIHEEMYNTIFYYLTEEQDPEVEQSDN